MVDDRSIGQRIRIARRLAGYTQGDVAAHMGLSVSTVSDIERGQRSIAGRELYQIAALLDQPVDFFLTSPPQTSPSFAYLFRQASERGLDKLALDQFERLCSEYALLEEITGTPPPPKPPDYSHFGFGSLGDADTLARMERARLGLGDSRISDITVLLDEEAGARVFHIPLVQNGLSGAAVVDHDRWPCILVNANEENYRRTFTIAHEYAHCLVHLRPSPEGATPLPAILDMRDPEQYFAARHPKERFANAFAASFLMPATRVSELYTRFTQIPGRFTDDMLYLMAKYFGVSHTALGWRLVALRKITRRDWREYLANGHSRSFLARQLGYDEEPKQGAKLRVPPRYQYLAWNAFHQKEISFSRLAELLGENLFELRESLREHQDKEKYEFVAR